MAFAVRTKPFRSPPMSRTIPRQRIVNRSRDILAVGPFYFSLHFFFPSFLSLFVAPPPFRTYQDETRRTGTRILVLATLTERRVPWIYRVFHSQWYSLRIVVFTWNENNKLKDQIVAPNETSTFISGINCFQLIYSSSIWLFRLTTKQDYTGAFSYFDDYWK